MNQVEQLLRRENSNTPVSAGAPLLDPASRKNATMLNLNSVSTGGTLQIVNPTRRQDSLSLARQPLPSSTPKNGASTLTVGPTFQTVHLNRIDTGSAGFERSASNVYLRSALITLRVRATHSSRGTYLRWGLLYDKYSNGTSSYAGEDVFQTVNDPPGGSPTFTSQFNSFRNLTNIRRFLVLKDETINFSTNIVWIPPTSQDYEATQFPPGDACVKQTLSLEPLITVFDPVATEGTQENIVNGNLLLWFYPYVDVNPASVIEITYMVRLYFSSTESGFTSWRAMTYLANPKAIQLMRMLRSQHEASNPSLSSYLEGAAELDPLAHLELTSTAYQLLNSFAKSDAFFGVEHGVANGLAYLLPSQISELKYYDYLRFTQPFVYRANQPQANAGLVQLINAVNVGSQPFRRVNKTLTNLAIHYRVLINRGYLITDYQFKTNVPIKLTLAVVYDRAPQVDSATNTNVLPTILDLFSDVDYQGNRIESPFKSVENETRFVFLTQRQQFLDTNDDDSRTYLAPGCFFFEDTVKLFSRNKFVSALTSGLSEGESVLSTTKEAVGATSDGLRTQFNPSSFIDLQQVNTLITSGAIYFVARTQLLDQNYSEFAQMMDLSTRIYYLD